MLQRDEDRHHLFFVFRPVKIHAVLIVQREHLLGKDGDDPAFGVVKLEVQPQNVSLQLPAQSLDVGDVLDQMEQLVGQLKGRAVRHGDEMALVEGEKFSFHMRHKVAGGVGNIRFVMQRGKLRLAAVENVFRRVCDLDPAVQGHDLGGGEQGTLRLAEALHVVDVG